MPDVFNDSPRGGYFGWRCEFKKPGGSTAPSQSDWQSAMARRGYRVVLFTDEDLAFADLVTYLELPPTPGPFAT